MYSEQNALCKISEMEIQLAIESFFLSGTNRYLLSCKSTLEVAAFSSSCAL